MNKLQKKYILKQLQDIFNNNRIIYICYYNNLNNNRDSSFHTQNTFITEVKDKNRIKDFIKYKFIKNTFVKKILLSYLSGLYVRGNKDKVLKDALVDKSYSKLSSFFTGSIVIYYSNDVFETINYFNSIKKSNNLIVMGAKLDNSILYGSYLDKLKDITSLTQKHYELVSVVNYQVNLMCSYLKNRKDKEV